MSQGSGIKGEDWEASRWGDKGTSRWGESGVCSINVLASVFISVPESGVKGSRIESSKLTTAI
ncbi:MAG: hypothetical protein J4G05_04485 [Chlorobi bacterium]|nr:hypothetical protein [Chlorobiota bacterium]